jgi:PAS domain S-box-containing protein
MSRGSTGIDDDCGARFFLLNLHAGRHDRRSDTLAGDTSVTQGRLADGNGRSNRRWALLWSLGLYGLCAASLAGACLYFFLAHVPGHRAAAIRRCQEELEVRAASHKMSLDHWLAAGQEDAKALANDGATLALIASGPADSLKGQAAISAAQVRALVGRLVRIGTYDRVVLLDASLGIAIEVGEKRPLVPTVLQAAAEVMAQEESAISFHRHADGSVALAFLALVRSMPPTNSGAGPTSGVLVLEADPSRWLYPYLAMRPMAAASAEAVLVRREGDDIVFLSPVRFNPAAPLTLRRSADTPGFAALAAIEGTGGFGAYVDYRGEPVFGVAIRLERAPWGLVVKVDQREALASYQRDIRHAGATALFAFVAFWTVALLLVRAWRRRAERNLEESEASFRATFEHSNIGKSLTGPGGKLLKVNRALADMLGYSVEEMQQATAAQFTHPDDVAETQEVIRSLFAGERTSHRTEKRYRNRDGHIVFADVSTTLLRDAKGAPLFMVASVVDISARKRAEAERERVEEQLRLSQRLEAIGGLAGGIAHDFNNVLSVILGCTELAIDRAREDDSVRDELLEVKKAGERAVALTRQLLAFSRKQVMQPVVLDLNHIAAGIEKMLRRILGEDIDYVQVLAPDLGMVWADPGQIEQVLMNLVVNARDAMPKGGKLTIETSNVDLDEEYAARHVVVKPGPYVQLVVTDTGCGMDEKIQARIFEPFFTTKDKAKGTGLGLSTVYGIVKQSGGDIWVYSEPGRGTTFKIHLPRLQGAVAPGPTVKPAVTRSVGSETILLVEDEEGVRNIAKRILGMAGYTVLTAGSASDALLTCEAHQGKIHLLLTDVVMPQTSGKALAERLALARPETKVLYMSGYTDEAIVHHGTLDAGTNFIGKPFTAVDLTRKIREVLDGAVTDS